DQVMRRREYPISLVGILLQAPAQLVRRDRDEGVRGRYQHVREAELAIGLHEHGLTAILAVQAGDHTLLPLLGPLSLESLGHGTRRTSRRGDRRDRGRP